MISPTKLYHLQPPSNPKAAAMSYSRHLPQEIITDILSRLPVKSLFRFKCVSLLWRSLITDPQFAKSHLHQTKTINYPEQKILTISYHGNLNLLDYNDGNPTSTRLEFPTVGQNHIAVKWDKVFNSCNGLLLVSRSDESIFLVNLSTRECKKLPICPFIPDTEHIDLNPYGVGYDSSTDDYKVLMLCCCYDDPIGCYISDVAVYSAKTNAWRRIEDCQYQLSGYNDFTGDYNGDSGVFLNGCLHFLYWGGPFCGITIIAFDLSSEIVREMQLPSSICTSYELMVLGGSLSFVSEPGEIWMMKEYGAKDSWTKLTIGSGVSPIIDVLWMTAADEFLLLEHELGWKQLIVYNPKSFTKRVICSTPGGFRFWGTCVETLISPFHAASNRKAAAMSNGRNLPQEMITDILYRLPVKSLFRFKCVSPSWKSLISDPYFAETHLGRTKTTSYPEQKIVTISYCGDLNLVDYNDGNPISTKLEFPTVEQHDAEKWVKVSSSCDGLLLVSRSDKSMFLLNPSTRECKKLPISPFFQKNVPFTSNPYGMGYDSSTDDYKVLMLSRFSCDHSIGSTITNVAIYSLKTNVWRRIEDSQYPFSGQNKHLFTGFKKGESGVFLNGCLHFLWKRTFRPVTIIAFDLSSEIVREMPQPSSLCTCDDLLLLGGSLSLVDTVTGEVWMMKEYGAKDSWTKLTLGSGDSIIDVLWMIAEDEVLLLEDACVERQLIVYNPYKFTERVIRLTPSNFTFGGTCVETLISPFYG